MKALENFSFPFPKFSLQEIKNSFIERKNRMSSNIRHPLPMSNFFGRLLLELRFIEKSVIQILCSMKYDKGSFFHNENIEQDVTNIILKALIPNITVIIIKGENSIPPFVFKQSVSTFLHLENYVKKCTVKCASDLYLPPRRCRFTLSDVWEFIREKGKAELIYELTMERE